MLYFAFIVLICNAPFKDERICYIIARSGKTCMVVRRNSLQYGGIIYFSAIFNDRSGRYNSSSMYIKAVLRTAVKSLIIASGDIKAEYLESSLPSDVITLLYPPAAQMITFITVWLNLIFLSLLIYFVNGCNEKIKLGTLWWRPMVLLDQ